MMAAAQPLAVLAMVILGLSGVLAQNGCNETLSGDLDSGYRGCQNRTTSGKTCQSWASQTPHAHQYSSTAFAAAGLSDGVGNHCRNPDGANGTSGTIWCFTTDPNLRWDYCLPIAEGECRSRNDCTYRSPDSTGAAGEVVGECVSRSSTQKMCECYEPYTGKNCQFKKCPVSLVTNFMCNGLQGEGTDYFGPISSEWNKYDSVDPVEFTPTQAAAPVGGLCDFNTGKCSCHSGYSGQACDIRSCPVGLGERGLHECSEQGSCVPERDGQNYICQCHSGFHGIDCSQRYCPVSTRGITCDNHGTCNPSNGTCTCEPGYYGRDCSLKICPSVNGRLCNGQGVCFASVSEENRNEGLVVDSSGKTVFSPGHPGCDQASELSGISMPDGSDSSTCRPFSGQKQGVCSCRWPYYGEDCTLKLCPNSSSNSPSGSGLQCDGHGTCDAITGTCTCEAGYFAKDCSKRVCPKSTLNKHGLSLECNGQGSCQRDWGKCKCFNRWFGEACEKLHCPRFPGRQWEGLVSSQGEMFHDLNGDDYSNYLLWTDECSGPEAGVCNHTTGTCMCHPGRRGFDCHLTTTTAS